MRKGMKSEYHGEEIDEKEKEGDDVSGSFSLQITRATFCHWYSLAVHAAGFVGSRKIPPRKVTWSSEKSTF